MTAGLGTPRVIALIAVLAAAPPQTVVEQIVVTVNGDVITRTEIEERVRITRGLAPAPAQPAGPAASLLADAADLLPGILSDAVDELLILQRAADLGIAVNEAEIDAVIASVRADSRVDSDEGFLALLASEGITLAALRTTTHRRILVERVRQQTARRVSVTDEEARRYFDLHRGEFGRGASVTFREVVVAVPPPGSVPDRVRDAALVKLVAAGDRLTAGTPFAQVAGDYSEAPSRAAGGLVAGTTLDTLEAVVRERLAAMRPGDVSGPVRTATGYCYLQLEEIAAPVLPIFSAARDEIVQRLLAVKRTAAVEALLDRLRGSAILQWKRADFEAFYHRRPR